MSSIYTQDKLRKAVVHFVSGRAVQAVARAALILVVVRQLPAFEYGAYMLLVGLSESLLRMWNFGLLRVGQRFLPEAVERASCAATRRLVAGLCLGQFALLAVAVSLLWFWWADFLAFAGFDEEHTASAQVGLALFLLVPMFRFLLEMLDALLAQALSQTCRALMPVGRLLLILALFATGWQLNLTHFLMIDVAVTVGCLSLAAYFLTNKLRAISEPDHVVPLPKSDMLRHAWHMSVTDVLGSLYSPGTLRLAISHGLGVAESGLFAFLQSLQRLIGRYLPGILLLGLVRPMLISRFRQPNGMALLQNAYGLLQKSNWLVVAGATVVALLGGDALVDLASGGRFPAAGDTLLWMFLLLALTSQRRVLEMFLQILGETNILRATAFLAPIVMSGVWFFAEHGLNVAISVVLLGVSVENLVLVAHLRRTASNFSTDWRGVSGILLPTFFAGLAGVICCQAMGMWPGLIVAALVAAGLLWVLKPFLSREVLLADRGIGRAAGAVLRPFTKPGT